MQDRRDLDMHDSPVSAAASDEGDAAQMTEEGPIERADKLSQLEKVIRGAGRDSLAVARGQKEIQTAMQSLLSRLDDLDLTIKGVAEEVRRASRDSHGHVERAEHHFAAALRDLEARVRDEMQWQLRRSALQAIFPALDDMDHVIASQRALNQAAETEDPLLEAMVLVRQKLSDGLRALGLEEIAIEEGVTLFDPGLHEAVDPALAELVEGGDLPRGTIISVQRPGYRLNGQVFRAPHVLVKS